MNFGWGRAAVVAVLMLVGCGRSEPVDPNAGKAEAAAFMEKNAKEEGVQTLASGLQYRVVQAGPAGGVSPDRNDLVKVDYEGKRVDDTVFDSSFARGAPAVFTPETVVPGAGAFAGAVIHFRGKVIPLSDLRVAFGLERGAATIDSRIVVIEIELAGEPTLVGLRTDKVHEVTTLARADSEAPPSVGMRWRPEFIQCLVKRGGEFIVVPDLQAIFNQQQDARQPVASATRH